MFDLFFGTSTSFSLFGAHHLGAILLTIAGSWMLNNYAKRRLSKDQQISWFKGISWVLVATIVVSLIIKIQLGHLNVKEDFPIIICYFTALISPLFTYTRKQWFFDVFFFWVFLFCLQAVITPDLNEGFPHYNYLKFWIVHAGLMILMIYAAEVLGFRLNLISILRAWLGTQFYIGFVVMCNYLLEANYFYLSAKPENASILDQLGEWPWYIIWAQLISIPYFIVVYAIFRLAYKPVQVE